MRVFLRGLSKLVLLFVLIFVSSCRILSRPGYHLVDDVYRYVLNSESRSLKYHVLSFPQTNTKESSLILLLHGFRDTGEHYLEHWIESLSENPVIVVAPDIDRNFSNEKQELEILYGLIQKIANQLNVSQDKIAIAGISSGGILVQWLVMNRPNLFNRAVIISAPLMFDQNMGWIGENNNLKVLYVYGARDDSIKADNVMTKAEDLKRKGLDISLMEDPEAGHEMGENWPGFILDWMKQN